MKIFIKLLKILLIIILLSLVALWLFSRSLAPVYNGNLELNNLQNSVEVYYDANGIPHIYAQNELDARRAFGYVHAQDRLWQMELIRRIAAGRLSEIFGEKLVRTDKFFSGLGIEEASEKTIKNLHKNSKAYKLAKAYLDGVNQFIKESATPVEFYLVGIDKEEYTLKDVYNVFGYMAFSFAIAHKTDPLLTEIKEKLGDEYLKELDISLENTTLIKTEKNPILESRFAAAINTIYDNLPAPAFIGSNSWVIGPEKTKNGKVIFANDPHIGFAQPSVWYQSHIVTPDYEMYGFNLALTPFPLLGHNRKYAYGMTMFENDDVDFYFEENNPKNENQYKTPDGFKDYNIRKKHLKVKDAEDLHYEIKVSQHGPVMNNIIDYINDKRPIAMQWIYTKLENQLLNISYDISHANSLKEFKEGAKKLHAPGLNVMYGDVQDNIAWFASGKLYKYRDSLNTKVILNGASGTDEIVEYLDFEENPQAVNPSWNYVYSANNQPDSIAGKLYPGYYLPEDRAKRIEHLLEVKNDFTQQDVEQMLYDVTSSSTPEIIKNISDEIEVFQLSKNEQKSLEILKNWKGYYGKEEIAPTIYNRFLYELIVNTYKDEMGAVFKQFINTPLQDKAFAVQVTNKNSVWWDDVSTANKKETKKEIVIKSFKNAIKFIENQLGNEVGNWTWNKVISVEYKHSIGEVPALRKYFNVGPFNTIGGNEVINNQIFNLDSTGYYKITAGPSTRRVIDFSNVENAKAILPTGQSGSIFSDYYKDQAEKYVNGEFVPMLLNEATIKKSKNKVVFNPKKLRD